jgi:predicted ATPase
MQTDDPNDSLRAFLQEKRLLLILDNCEHMVDAAADLAEHLFLHAPRVHVLTTSREGLRVEGEHVHHLRPLETPTDHVGLNADSVQTFPAVQVFLERAAASGWSADLTDADVPMLVETCRRLDGIPLALELSASFVGEFGLQGMTAVLDNRLRLLRKRGRRTAPLRQQTLHALVAWSYDRLAERERVVLRRLSVLVGAFPFDAAKEVVLERGDSDESLAEVMNELVGKSLLSATAEGGAVVYRLLETTRAYALERLAESGDLERVSLRHASFFAERLGCPSDGRPQPFQEQPSVLANARAALQWSLAAPEGQATGAKLAAASTRMLIDLGLLGECRAMCRQALDVMGQADAGTLVELRLQEGLALSTMWSGSGDGVRLALDRGLDLARALGGGDHEVRLLEHLNFLKQRTGDVAGALEVAELSVVSARVGTTAAKVTAQWMLARSHYMCGHQVLALEHCEGGMRLAAGSGQEPSTFVGYTPAMLCLARVLWLRGQVDRALKQARNIVREAATLNHPVYQCIRLIHCVPIIAWHGQWEEAQHLVDTLDELIERCSLGSYRGYAMGLRGKLLVEAGRPHEGCRVLQRAVSILKAAGLASLDAYFSCAVAEGLAATGALDDGLAVVEGGIELSQRRGGTWELPELLRLKGLLLASRSGTDARAAEETLSSAIELARCQGALVWELRATTALVRENSGSLAARRALSTVCAKFTEGTTAPDVQAARNLLGRGVDGEPHRSEQTRGALYHQAVSSSGVRNA